METYKPGHTVTQAVYPMSLAEAEVYREHRFEYQLSNRLCLLMEISNQLMFSGYMTRKHIKFVVLELGGEKGMI